MKFLFACFVFVIALACAFAECPTICTMEYNPQCGLGYYNGKFEWGTYGNPCGLGIYNCNNPTKIRYPLTGVGECTNILPTATSDPPPKPVCNDMCPMNYQPVCGLGYFDGSYKWETYGNACGLGVYNCQNPNKVLYAIKNVGECTEIFPTRNSEPELIVGIYPPPFPPREETIQPYAVEA